MTISFEAMQGALGSILLVWARIEKTVREDIVSAYGELPTRAHGIAGALRTWENAFTKSQPDNSLVRLLASALVHQLQKPLNVRNGVCHGLDGISAATEQVQARVQWTLNGEKHEISWDDLQAQLMWLSKVPFAVSTISNMSLGKFESRASDTVENRAWWLSEFSLDVTKAEADAIAG